LYQRAGLTLLCGAILAGCGGGGGSMALSGTIATLNKPDLVLINTKNGETLPIASGRVSFVFTKLVKPDEDFDIEIQNQPTGAKCKALDNSNIGKASVYTAYSIRFQCITNPYSLGGTVTGLDTKGLVLTNGSDTVSILPPTRQAQRSASPSRRW
jgi:predicted RNA methylase